MRRTKIKHKDLPTYRQILERIGNIPEGIQATQKIANLTFAVFASFIIGVILVVSVPIEFRETALAWAFAHWGANLVWAIVIGFGWRTLTESESRQLSRKERAHRLRAQAMWFRLWKGGFLLLVSTLLLLLGIGLLRHLGLRRWVDGLVVAVYGLIYVFSLWQRQRICHTKIEGWSPNTRWGRIMHRLGAIGPAAAASVCSALTIATVRLNIVPKSIGAGFFGILGVVLACLIVPQVIYDLIVARVHFRLHRTEGGTSDE